MTAPQPPENNNPGGQQAPGENNENKGGAAAEQQTPSTAGDLPTTTHGAGQEGAQGISSALDGSSGGGTDAAQVAAGGAQQATPADTSADATQVVAGGTGAPAQPQQAFGQQPPQQPQWGVQQPPQQWGQQPPQQPGTPSGGFQQPAWGAQPQPGAQPQGQWGQPQQQWGQPQPGWGQPASSGNPPFLQIAMWGSFVIGGLGLLLGLIQLPIVFEAMEVVNQLGSFRGGRLGGVNIPSRGTVTTAVVLAIVQILLYLTLAVGAFLAGVKGNAQGRLIAGGSAAGVAVIGSVVFFMLPGLVSGLLWIGIVLNAVLAVLWFLPQTAAAIGTTGGFGGGQQYQAWGQPQGQWGQPQQQWGQPQGQWGQPQPQQQWGQQPSQQPQAWGQQPGQQQGWPGQQ